MLAHSSSPPLRQPVRWQEFIALPDDDRRELIDGELIEVEVPTFEHENIVAAVIQYLRAWVRAHQAGVVLASGYKVRISETRGFMPDVQHLSAETAQQAGKQGLEQARPELVVEVISPSGRRYDRVVKLNGYAAIGVPEYWLIDPEGRTLERLMLQGEHYLIAQTAEEDADFAPPSYEGLVIPLAELWLDDSPAT